MTRRFEDYLGDGAYVYVSEFGEVVLYTSNGYRETNTVVLDQTCMAAFDRWRKRVNADHQAAVKAAEEKKR